MPRFHRKVIKIRAEDSPNVRYGLAQERLGVRPTDEILVPGVLPYLEYKKRRKLWNVIQQCVSLDAEYYLGAEVFLYPAEHLNVSHRLADALRGRKRIARGMGIDPAEGGDSTVWSIVDELGLIYQLSMKTPDTSIIPGHTAMLMREYNVPADRVCIDRGGGGYEHACQIRRSLKLKIRTVGFGESLSLDPKHGRVIVQNRLEIREEHYAYKSRRAQMYGELADLLSPSRRSATGDPMPQFALPVEYVELRRQLSPIPRWYDEEGRLFIPPKKRKATDKDTTEKVTLDQLIGCSPDEADSLVLAVHAMLHRAPRSQAGTIGSHRTTQ